jgi:hypothetical protein
MVEAARTTLPKQALGEALTYALGQWDKITAILSSGDLPIDNNAVYAERGINRVMPRPGLCRAAA